MISHEIRGEELGISFNNLLHQSFCHILKDLRCFRRLSFSYCLDDKVEANSETNHTDNNHVAKAFTAFLLVLRCLIQLFISLFYVICSCPHMRIQPLKLLTLILDLNIDILGNIIDVTHNFLDLFYLNTSLLNDCGHVVSLCHHPQVLIVLYSHLLLICSVELAVTGCAFTLPVCCQLEVVLFFLLDLSSCLIETICQLFHLSLKSFNAFPFKILFMSDLVSYNI